MDPGLWIELAKHSVLLPVLGAAGYYILRLTRANTELTNKVLQIQEASSKAIQELGNKRTEDAQKVTTQLLELNQKFNGAIHELSGFVDDIQKSADGRLEDCWVAIQDIRALQHSQSQPGVPLPQLQLPPRRGK